MTCIWYKMIPALWFWKLCYMQILVFIYSFRSPCAFMSIKLHERPHIHVSIYTLIIPTSVQLICGHPCGAHQEACQSVFLVPNLGTKVQKCNIFFFFWLNYHSLIYNPIVNMGWMSVENLFSVKLWGVHWSQVGSQRHAVTLCSHAWENFIFIHTFTHANLVVPHSPFPIFIIFHLSHISPFLSWFKTRMCM